jgi:hypothetical protein
VAVLAAALRAVPDLPASPDEPDTVTEDPPSPVLGHGAARAGEAEPPPALDLGDVDGPDRVVDLLGGRNEDGPQAVSAEPPGPAATARTRSTPRARSTLPAQSTLVELGLDLGLEPEGAAEVEREDSPELAPKPILAARPRLPAPPNTGDRAADW